MRRCFKQSVSIALALILLPATGAFARTVTGAGSTFVQPIVAKWAEDYRNSGKDTISYQSIGSGAGIKAIQAGTVDFGATDKPLDSKELAKYGLFQFPVVVGAVVPVFNLPGLPNGKLRFTGKLLADIFQKKIVRWDDPQIAAQNRNVKLPALPITVVHRSDGSGTTYNWTDFLAKTSDDWRKNVGVGLTVTWPTGVGGKGNAGVAAGVQQTKGSIGYVEYSYAVQYKLSFGQVENAFRLSVSPTPETIQAAAATVDWKSHEDFAVMMTYASGPAAYPIAATTFILMPKTPKDPAQNQAALSFFRWALEYGDKQAEELNFVALPPNLIARVEAYWAKHAPLAQTSAR